MYSDLSTSAEAIARFENGSISGVDTRTLMVYSQALKREIGKTERKLSKPTMPDVMRVPHTAGLAVGKQAYEAIVALLETRKTPDTPLRPSLTLYHALRTHGVGALVTKPRSILEQYKVLLEARLEHHKKLAESNALPTVDPLDLAADVEWFETIISEIDVLLSADLAAEKAV